jgi:hypothetical protein
MEFLRTWFEARPDLHPEPPVFVTGEPPRRYRKRKLEK